jgi:hypothetical protein
MVESQPGEGSTFTACFPEKQNQKVLSMEVNEQKQ